CREWTRMHKKLQRLKPTLANCKGAILFIAQLTLQKLNELSYETLPHPAYSLDLSLIDYHFFKHPDHYL
ncbi:Histone-lysine N-methyltransferase SETMAR, partial [Habropoda laboriosa]